MTGKKPIQVRWVDVDKFFGVYRSRLVAKDFRPRSTTARDSTPRPPPPKVVKFLIMQCRQGEVRKVMLIDVSKAHLYAPSLYTGMTS